MVKAKSEVSVQSKASSRKAKEHHEEVPTYLDQLEMKIVGLWLSKEDPPYHAVKVTFFDKLILSAIVKPYGLEDKMVTQGKERVFAKGTLSYDPADYEKMCLFADTPLIVNITPLKGLEYGANPLNTPNEDALTPTKPHTPTKDDKKDVKKGGKTAVSPYPQPPTAQRPMRGPDNIKDISSCNIDILPLFLDQDNMCVRKRLQPMRSKKYMERQSWDNLPLLTMSITALRHEENARHHRVLQNANSLKVTVVGAYNLLTPYNVDCYYTAATKIPMCNEMENEMTMYTEGISVPRKFNCLSFYPRWETLRLHGEHFVKGDEKLVCDIGDIFNPADIDLEYYLKRAPICYNAIWGSFHRSLLIGDAERRLWEHLRQWKWPVEVHYYGDAVGGLSFMGFMDLFQLLYPGVSRLVVAVPLHWFNMDTMFGECGCGVLLMPNNDLVGTPIFNQAATKVAYADSVPTTTTEDEPYIRQTGADENTAFVIVEVQFGHPMIPESIPPYIHRSEMMQMLAALEPDKGKRACRERGQLANNWRATVRAARNALRCVPHHGLMEMCVFNRQLSDSRTRAELLTSFWIEAAVFVNNNFVLEPYLESQETYEELLLMSHICLMKITRETLVGKDDWHHVDPTLRAARHARQLNDHGHAMELYMQAAVQCPSDCDPWRELSTLLKDIDWEWATVCLNKSLTLNVRHPLTILSKACMVFEENVDAAEPFFTSLLNLYPLWPTAYIVAIAYCHTKEYFILADTIKQCLASLREEHIAHDIPMARAWERELGDFWQPTILLPGMNVFYEVTDLLLRIRAVRMAEVCLSLALAETGETAAYFHLVSLCFRLKGDIPNALCLIQKGIDLFGQNADFRCLQAECYHQMEDPEKAIAAFEKGKGANTPYSILLSLTCFEPKQVRPVLIDLLNRQPSAYAWMALANDWVMRAQMDEDLGAGEPSKSDAPSPLVCAAACAVQALKWDRRAGRAWALLSKLVKPAKRSEFCAKMAAYCGYTGVEDIDIQDLQNHLQDPACFVPTETLKDCRCHLCKPVRF